MKKNYSHTCFIIALSCALLAISAYDISKREEYYGNSKTGIVLEKRKNDDHSNEIFHMYWKNHPTKKDNHEELRIDADTYYSSNVGQLITFPLADDDYPVKHRYNRFINAFMCLFLLCCATICIENVIYCYA